LCLQYSSIDTFSLLTVTALGSNSDWIELMSFTLCTTAQSRFQNSEIALSSHSSNVFVGSSVLKIILFCTPSLSFVSEVFPPVFIEHDPIHHIYQLVLNKTH
jgi:hypothetical protein